MRNIDDIVYPQLIEAFPNDERVLDIIENLKMFTMDNFSELEEDIWQKYIQLKREQNER